jgi:pyruvate dehydrogenase E2 component (dihydrolipoamide acetyltransferase)
MARWKVSRHAPILPPHNSLIVAHTAPLSSEAAFLGATYDHRALSGGDVVRTLQKIGTPPED